MLAKQISKAPEIYKTADVSLKEVFSAMMELACDCMPILESSVHKNVIGVITEHVICQKIINDEINPQRTSAGRIMSGNFTTVSADATLEECLELFNLCSMERLFVVDDNGAYRGVVTKEDVLKEIPVVNLETVIDEFSTATAVLPTKIHLAY